MGKDEIEPVLPQIIRDWRNRKFLKKQKEIDMLNLQIEEAKLKKKLKEIKNEMART